MKRTAEVLESHRNSGDKSPHSISVARSSGLEIKITSSIPPINRWAIIIRPLARIAPSLAAGLARPIDEISRWPGDGVDEAPR